MTIRHLTRAVLESFNVTTAAVVASIEDAIRDRASGQMWAAPKSVLTPPDGRYLMTTLAVGGSPPLMVVKSLVLNPHNPARGLPLINGLVTVLDGATGEPVAVLDGNWVTEVRTAGLSAVAAKAMARSDSAVAGFVGSGAQARSHLLAFADLFPLKVAKVSGRGKANIDALAACARQRGIQAVICDTPEEAIAGADIVVTTLTRDLQRAPFLDAAKLAPGSFSAIVDLAEPWIPASLTAFDTIAIDDLDQEKAMPVKLAPLDLVKGDLASLVLESRPRRTSANERNAFIFRGVAIGDFAISVLACRLAKKLDAGRA